MDELGSILREAREMKGLTLTDVQDEIRINSRFLDALERGEYGALPTPVHVRGYLRNYARFLELDPAPLLERYEANVSQQPPPPAPEPPEIEPAESVAARSEQPFFNPVNVDLDGASSGTESTVRLVIIVALLITIGLAASRFVPLLRGEGDGRDNLPQLIEGILNGGEDEASGEDPVVEENLTPAATSDPILPTGRNNPDTIGTSQAAPAPTRPALPATMDEIHLRLDITERTWMRVTIDGEVVFEDQVTQNEGPFEWDAEVEAHLLTGNAAGVFITINDTEIGRLGGRGEVQEQTWTTTGN
jgi:transcriptional regulator with XRE-family HTH domain